MFLGNFSGGDGNFILSTSLLGYKRPVYGATFPMVEDGYGSFYSILDEGLGTVYCCKNTY